MTKKDFEIVATIISVIGSENRGVLLTQAEIACEYLEKTNASFDREKFCGFVLGQRARIEETLKERGHNGA